FDQSCCLVSEKKLFPRHFLSYTEPLPSILPRSEPYTMVQNDNHAVEHNIPPQLTPFLGRTGELLELSQLLLSPSTRLITIWGMGGLGKTRLAIELASTNLAAFERVCFVSLTPYRTADDVPLAIGAALHIRFQGGASPLQQILDALGSRRSLLIL